MNLLSPNTQTRTFLFAFRNVYIAQMYTHNRYQQSHPSNNNDIHGEGINFAELYPGYDEPDAPVDIPVAWRVPSQIPLPVNTVFQGNFSTSGMPLGPSSLAQSAYAPPGPEYMRSLPGVHGGQHLGTGGQNQATADMMVTHPSDLHMSQRVTYGSQTTAAPSMDYYPFPSATQVPNQPSGRGTLNHQNYQHELDAAPGSSRVRPQQRVPLPSSSITQPDIMQSFPLDTEDHRMKRENLNMVIHSTWRQNNEFEPEASLLLQFMSWDPSEKKYHCLFWKDGRPCGCSCRSRDHAKGHIRSHLDLVPFVCDSRCPYSDTGCHKRYPAIEPLQKHRMGKTMCDHCSLPVLPTNMKRHIQNCHPDMIIG